MKETDKFDDPLADQAKRERASLAARDASIVEGTKGSVFAAIGSVAGHLAGNRFIPQYAAANFRLKTLCWSSVVVAAFWVRSEQEQLRQLRLQYGYEGTE